MELEVMNLIEILEDNIEDASHIPIINKSFIDKDELLDIIKDIRLKMPEEIKEAQKIAADRQRILADAQQEADSILKSAENKVTYMVSENEITKLAEEKSKEIIENAQNEAKNMRVATKQYVTDTLNGVENTLNEVLIRVREDRNGY